MLARRSSCGGEEEEEEEDEDEEVSLLVFYCDVTIKLAVHSTVDNTENKLKIKKLKKN